MCVMVSGAVPNYQGCIDPVSRSLPYCDASLALEQRISDLISRLSIEEKVGILGGDPALGDTCSVFNRPIPRLGLPGYFWLEEVNTQANSACLGPNRCATTFPGPLGLAASFNRSLWRDKGDVISTELRAFNNLHWFRYLGPKPDSPVGLTGFGPNINLYIDPRWGRDSEVPGEDPFLSGTYAAEYTLGLQQIDEQGFFKMKSFLKHFTAYNVETNRFNFNANLSTFDLWDSHLRQFEIGMKQGRASGVMCSYTAINGIPSCANSYLMDDIMRKKWSNPDALSFSDCGAFRNMRGDPLHIDNDDETIAAITIMNGTDIEAGSSIWFSGNLAKARDNGLVSDRRIDEAVRRALLQRFQVGLFDDPDTVSWTKIHVDQINSEKHQSINAEAGIQSIVLLKNDNILPINSGQRIAVVGPQAIGKYGYLSDYFGDEVCWNGTVFPNQRTWKCIPSIAEEISRLNGAKLTSVYPGVDISSVNSSLEQEQLALDAAAESDIVILVIGIDRTIETESVDRPDFALPGLQQQFSEKILMLGKPTVLVMVNGGSLAIDKLIEPSRAIIETFNPALTGARAVARSIFGLENRWGKLPVTIYPLDFQNQISIQDMSMTLGPGRTYRYYKGTPLFPFGHGLSLTKFSHSCIRMGSSSSSFSFRCSVSNQGPLNGDEVIMVFHQLSRKTRSRVEVHHPVPLKQLVDFERVSVKSGSSVVINFEIPRTQLAITNQHGERTVYDGEHVLSFSRGHGLDVQFSLHLQSE